MNHQDTALMVCTCDAYSDVIPAFFHFIKKYWSDCPYDIYICSELIDYGKTYGENVKTLLNTKKTTWSKRVINSLKRIPNKNIFIILDDFFILSKVNQSEIDKCICYLNSDKKNAYFSFRRNHDSCEESIIYKGYKEHELFDNFWVNLLPGIWKKDVLLKLLSPYEDPWQFEWFGTERAKLYGMKCFEQYESYDPIIDFDFYTDTGYGLCQGKWTKSTEDLFKKEGIDIDLSVRGFCTVNHSVMKTSLPKMTFRHRLLYAIYGGLPAYTLIDGYWRIPIKVQIKEYIKSPGLFFVMLKRKNRYLFGLNEGEQVDF